LTPIKPGRCLAPQHPRIPIVLETPMKILLPVDGSEHTKRMLSYIADHEELLGSGHEYTILTVIAPVPAYATRFLDRSTVEGYYDEQAEQVLKPVRAFVEQKHWKVHVAHTPGHAAEAIAARAAADNTDLIVMGTHGHTALGNVVLGSVASGVLARSKVPVLLIC
jgi:nucleotide-binding universal stress UspA family protein